MAAINANLPSWWHIDDTFFQDRAASANFVMNVGSYAYDAIAVLGLLACQLAPTGPLPADFAEQFWALSQTEVVSGLSGSVKFDNKYNRDVSTANYIMQQIKLTADNNEEIAIGTYDNDAGEWVLTGAMTFNGDSTAPVEAVSLFAWSNTTPFHF